MVLPLLAALAACPGTGDRPRPSAAPRTPPATAAPAQVQLDDATGRSGLLIELTPADADRPRRATAAADAADPAPLSSPQLDALLGRTERLQVAPRDLTLFAKRDDALPPPRTGETVDLPFPPPPSAPPPAAADGPPRVVRFAPEGEVPIAPTVSVTFDQPMVELSTDAHSNQTAPIQMRPRVAGSWRWLGTRTATFEPEVRLPMATAFEVWVPADTPSATGQPTGEEVRFQFQTPPLSLQRKAPLGDEVDLQPVIQLGFDQQIDAAALLEHLEVHVEGEPVAVRLATAAEVAASEPTARGDAPNGRDLFVRPEEPLPRAARVEVELRAGAPSAEGPRRTTAALGFSFRTYSPLALRGVRCGSRDDRCRPHDAWYLEFNNELDPASVQESTFVIDPTLDLAAASSWSRLILTGEKPGATTYTLTLPPTLRDRFGQALGATDPIRVEVDRSDPTLTTPYGHVTVLDPDAPPVLRVFTRNHATFGLRVYAVQPEDWPAYLAWRRNARLHAGTRPPPGRKLADERVPIDAQEDRRVETRIPLDRWLREGLGHLVVQVEPTRAAAGRDPLQNTTWVQATQLAIDVAHDGDQLLMYASELSTGAPVADASVQVLPSGGEARSGADGLATLPALERVNDPIVVVGRGEDRAFLHGSDALMYADQSWDASGLRDEPRWLVFDDRALYRPGETVHLKGFVRRFTRGPSGDLAALRDPNTTVHWVASDPRGDELASGSVVTTAYGGFDLSFELPDNANLGHASVRLRSDAAGPSFHAFQIQEFRRPEFEVTASLAPGPHLLGTTTRATLRAAYFAGGGLPGAQTTWRASATPASYSPPGHSGYRFGPFDPWWWRGGGDAVTGEPYEPTTLITETDAAGRSAVAVRFAALSPVRPMTVRLDAQVQDVNRQTWSTHASTVLHPASRYVGLRAARSFFRAGEPVAIEAIVTSIDGDPHADVPIAVTMYREQWTWSASGYRAEDVEIGSCSVLSAAAAVGCSFEPPRGGAHKLVATITDPAGRPNRTELRVWVQGGDARASSRVRLEEVLLVPDADSYAPGEVAEVLLQAPFAPAEATITWRRDGLLHVERLSMPEPSAVVTVPIEDAHTPNLHLHVELVGQSPRVDADGTRTSATRPAYASGTLDLPVSLGHRTFGIDVAPAAASLAPGEPTHVDVTVRDPSGAPVEGVEVAVVVVDEAVLALTGYRTPDPMAVFYARRPARVRDRRLRSYLHLDEPASTDRPPPPDLGRLGGAAGRSYARAQTMVAGVAPSPEAAPGALDSESAAAFTASEAMDEGQGSASPIALRSDFSALALFAPDERTDRRGRLRAAFTVPDSLTRYRVMVIAADEARRFGVGEATITARQPVMLRPSAPRFLNFGDRFELPLVVQNQTDAPIEVQLAVEATNAVFLDALDVAGDPQAAGARTASARVTVPADDRIEVRFPAAADMAGTARFQAVVAAGAFTDAVRFELPVWTPATSEAFATYGVLDAGAITQPIHAPSDVWPQFGGLEVTASSTNVAALTDAVIYLADYPFECSEQIASRVLALAALRDVLEAFDAAGLPPSDELEAAVARDLDRLQQLQRGDGGFAFWRASDPAWPHLSIHVAHALARAEAKGFEVPPTMRQRSLGYLQQIEAHLPPDYSEPARWTLTAYALYVRELLGDADLGAATALFERGGRTELPLEAQGWLLPTLAAGPSRAPVDTILRHLGNRVSETAAAAHFVSGFDDGERHVLLSSDRRLDGVLLDALIRVDRDNDLIPKLVEGLLAHRVRGHWGNTQENAFVLLALDRYFRTFEAVTPDFVARAWLGERYAGEQPFRGRETKRARIDIPMSSLTAQPSQDLVLAKQGDGRMYYRIGLRYAPDDLELAALERGFTVERRYAPIDAPDDVRQDADGTWRIRAGARVRVHLSMVAPSRRYHVALVDPLPAGLEPVNPALLGSGPAPLDAASTPPGARPGWWWSRTWYEHQNLRDERVEAFASLLWDGVHTYSYEAEATTPGRFVAPPARAEEMYSPEVFGRSATDRVIIE